MKATTIKIEGNLLKEIEEVCPPSRSVTAFVRDVLHRDLRRRRMAEATTQYKDFLASHPEEGGWLTEWEQADLIRPPRSRQRKIS